MGKRSWKDWCGKVELHFALAAASDQTKRAIRTGSSVPGCRQRTMRYRQLGKIVVLVVLGALAVILLAGVLSLHQIYPITDAKISKAPDAQTRQFLIHERDRRNRGERFSKMEIGALLTIDLALFRS